MFELGKLFGTALRSSSGLDPTTKLRRCLAGALHLIHRISFKWTSQGSTAYQCF